MTSGRLGEIEEYVRNAQSRQAAHDYKHADRVRHWAVEIAASIHYSNEDLVEATALLHDIGLTKAEGKMHASVGAEIAALFLSTNSLFSPIEIDEIAHAIRSHNSLHDNGPLASILMDSDILDLLGAVGIMRAFTSKHFIEEYDPADIKGETWGNTSADTTLRFQSGLGIGPTIIDQINFQISCQGNLRSEFARERAIPLVQRMRSFIIDLENEVDHARA